MTGELRILVVDDHDLVRETLAAFLAREELGDVQTASDLDAALARVRQAGRYDVVLLDYDMPGMDGLRGLERMLAANADGAVALMSGNVPRGVAELALRTGARGFVPKTLGSRALVAAVRFMATGAVFAPYEFMSREAAPDPAAELLSPREAEVLRGLCAGKSNKEIALDLDLQEVTVKLHVKNLSRKLGARNRTHAAMIARDRKLL
jgi:two-component system nitrate/nitrite response regulator NarL